MFPARGKLERKRLLSAPLFCLRPLSSSFPFVWSFGLHGPFTARVSVSQSAGSSGSMHVLGKLLASPILKDASRISVLFCSHLFHGNGISSSPYLSSSSSVEDRAEVYAIVSQCFLLCYESASHTRSESLTRIYLFLSFYEIFIRQLEERRLINYCWKK